MKKLKLGYKETGIFIIILAIGFFAMMHFYLMYVDAKVLEITESANATYTTKEKKLETNNFETVDLATELEDFLEKSKNKDITTVIYYIENENFYFNIGVKKEEDNYTFSIEKIVDSQREINARMNYTDIKEISYKTGNINNSTVLKLSKNKDFSYVILTGNTHYFLGSDIDEVVFENNRFYYKTYNPKYDMLKLKNDCSKETEKEIDDFNYYDNYYKYGKINFLDDYYQKIYLESINVKKYCDKLAGQNN